MLAKCANPMCENRFRYLREGMLFSFPGLPMSSQIGRNSETREHWWLCAQCANTLTLHFDLDTGIHVLPQDKVRMWRMRSCRESVSCRYDRVLL